MNTYFQVNRIVKDLAHPSGDRLFIVYGKLVPDKMNRGLHYLVTTQDPKLSYDKRKIEPYGTHLYSIREVDSYARAVTADYKKADTAKKTVSAKNKGNIRSGEFLSVNDVRTRGHKSLIVSVNKKERKKEVFKHLPITHSPTTRRIKNVSLTENPEGIDEQSYILPKVQKSKLKDNVIGKKHPNIKIKNPTDKSIVRNIKKKSKR